MVVGACGGGGGDQESDPPAREVPVIAWDLPQSRVDGSKLDSGELAEIQIWYREEEAEEYQLLAAVDGTATRYVPYELTSGAYQLALVVIDVNQRTSLYSQSLWITVP